MEAAASDPGQASSANSPAQDYVDGGVGADNGLANQLERLWAPYRAQYVTKHPKVEDPFLEIPQGSDEDGLIVARGRSVYAVLNLFPYNPGHLLLVPYRQVADYTELTAEETAELAEFTKIAIRTIRSVSAPDAINVGLNLGKAAGGSVPTHLHQHVVPRWTGDASFMTVMTGTKVLPQTLRETRALFAAAWPKVVAEMQAEAQADVQPKARGQETSSN